MRRLTGLDASFLYLETPNNHMHVASTYIYDPADAPDYGFDRVRTLVENRLHLLPPFRRRLVVVPFGLHHPFWIEDPDFDLDYHLRRATLRAPGDKFALAEFAADFMSRPLDRRRPLWEMYVVDGLEGGKVAMLSKTHHCAIDGASGAELTANLLDLTPEPVIHQPPPWTGERVPSELEMFGYAVNSLAKQPAQLVQAVQSLVTTTRAKRSRREAEPDKATPPGMFKSPRTSLNVPIGPHRSFGFTSVTLDDIKTIRAAFGGTVNDVVLAVCAGALRQYLLTRDELPDDPLVAMVPISVRTQDQKGAMGNRVANMLVSLATNVADPGERFAAIRQATAASKEQANAIGADTLSNWTEFAAPALAARAARLYSSMRLAERHKPAFNVTISNVPGPNIALYSAGALMTEWYPMGPIFDGTGLNMTVMSYRGVVHFGLVACRETVPDVWGLAAMVDQSFAELLIAARPSSDPTATAKTATRAPRRRSSATADNPLKGTGAPASRVTRAAAAKSAKSPSSAARARPKPPSRG